MEHDSASRSAPETGAAGDTAADELELHVGNAIYAVTLDQPFSIATPYGERTELVLRRKRHLRFEGCGISFDYHPLMEVSWDTEADLVTITAETASSPQVMIQLSPPPSTVEQIHELLVGGYMREFEMRTGRRIEESDPVERRVMAGAEREGRRLEYLLMGERLETQVFTFPGRAGVVAVVLQHSAEDANLAARCFPILTESLRV